MCNDDILFKNANHKYLSYVKRMQRNYEINQFYMKNIHTIYIYELKRQVVIVYYIGNRCGIYNDYNESLLSFNNNLSNSPDVSIDKNKCDTYKSMKNNLKSIKEIIIKKTVKRCV